MEPQVHGATTTTDKSELTGAKWTNEKHLHYLNSMEASFVRKMYENYDKLNIAGPGGGGTGGGGSLRLDRYLPDSSDSTLDLNSHRNNKAIGTTCTSTTTADVVGPRQVSGVRTKRAASSHRHDSSKDQVVPDIDKRNGGKDERDRPLVA